MIGPDALAGRARAAVDRGRRWLDRHDDARCPLRDAVERVPGGRPVVDRPSELLSADPAAVRLLDRVGPASSPDPDWEPVLAALTVLAVRAGDVDATATVLRCAGRLALADGPVLRRGAGWLCVRQDSDGGFGDPGDRLRLPLTRNCVVALGHWTGRDVRLSR